MLHFNSVFMGMLSLELCFYGCKVTSDGEKIINIKHINIFL